MSKYNSGATGGGGGSVADADETTKGKIEIATSSEVQTGTDNTRAVTPAGLQACTATTTRAGVVELATTAEADLGADSDRATTPEGVASYVLTKINALVLANQGGGTTLTAAQSGSVVYHTAGSLTLPNSCAAGTNFTIINNTGGQVTVGLNTNGATVTGLPNNVVDDHMSKTFVCIDLTGSASTWAIIG